MIDVYSTPTNLPDFSDLDLNFDIIDSHHHLFDLDAVYYPWLTDDPESHFLLGNYDELKKNYLPKDYFHLHFFLKCKHVDAHKRLNDF